MTLKFFFTYKTNVKERWKNKELLNVLVYEFRNRDEAYFRDAIDKGVIKVNGEIVKPTKKLKLTDYLEHTVHMHEPIPPKIDVIAKEDDYVVVNKPAGVPCHPTGGYLFYSVTKSLFGDKKVACVNRLDMPVSGVMIITFNNLSQCMEKIKDAKKFYIAKVKGIFPNHIEVNKKIVCKEGRKRYVSEEGKECLTIFDLISHNESYSLVKCQPITGRTHQIRIHLQSIGFPIVNDLIYGDEEPEEIETKEVTCDANYEEFDDQEMYKCVVKHCKGENNRSFNFKKYFICLHAWKYFYDSKEYEAPLPEWCRL
ncbi:DRAP deaminase [Nosema bombycis CQ1]|uniref:DRAP deaminase n=1 Tax=Nosema bombycis (strain CQ1 / CVCC 102059) TaxID=578461 RepID=R0MM54_NOSB1|nr:DRAP deaminase [Nosema bombycis CQ1]|eukprot:EOB13898.1 DRAP deaminase [Nosema bombycis CQ1]